MGFSIGVVPDVPLLPLEELGWDGDAREAAAFALLARQHHLGIPVDLSWATAAEIDSYGFYINRSADNNLSHAERVHFEPAFGGSGGHTYSYTDTPPDEGPYWYWLSDIDTFGKETFHMPDVARTLHSNFNYLPLLIGR